MTLLHFEIRNAIAQQTADATRLLKHGDAVARTRELLRRSHPRGARPDDGDCLACVYGRCLRRHPAFFPTFVDDEMFNRLDAYGVVVDVQRARRFAWCRAHSAGEFWEIVGAVQGVERLLPVAVVDQVVPIRDDVVDWAPRLAKRNAAIHAARALLFGFVVFQRHHEFAVVIETRFRRFSSFAQALKFHESGNFSHDLALFFYAAPMSESCVM